MCQICQVNYGSHMGEYIRYKLDVLGIKQRWLSNKIQREGGSMSPSYLSKLLSNKAELLPSEMAMFSKHLPSDFFDEYYETNPKLKPYHHSRLEVVLPGVEEERVPYETKGTGYRITLEIDPIDFDPDLLDPLSESLKSALKDFHSRLQEDKKRTK
ncbi:hypothetical protein [Owenweeksia hongkongensis]|nr:hypothetical protein [Owenweeksia hongkongensis]